MKKNIVGWKTLNHSGELHFACHEFKLERDALAVVGILRNNCADIAVHAFTTYREFDDWARGHAFQFVESALRTHWLSSTTGQEGLAKIIKKALPKSRARR